MVSSKKVSYKQEINTRNFSFGLAPSMNATLEECCPVVTLRWPQRKDTSLSFAALFRSSKASFARETAKTSSSGSTLVMGFTGLQQLTFIQALLSMDMFMSEFLRMQQDKSHASPSLPLLIARKPKMWPLLA